MNLIFCGTPRFAVPTLEKLHAEKFQIDLVVTNPDEPAGRGYETKSPPVKESAASDGLAIFQPQKLKDPATREFLTRYHPDAIIVVAYGHIIPPWMIELPRLGCINLHASLLPRYRGAAPIPWAIVRGEHTTGLSTMLIDAGLDTGDILLQRETEIRDDDNTETLSQRLSILGADLMVETLKGLENGEIHRRPQDAKLATLAPILKKEDGWINWSLSAEEIARRVRGLRPWPGAFTTFRGTHLNLWLAAPAPGPEPEHLAVGTIMVDGGKLLVECGGKSILEVKELQLAGRKRIPARDFLNGVRLKPDEKLG